MLRYQCSPYHLNSALYPVIEQFERAAGFSREDTAEQKLDKMQALLAGSAEQIAESCAAVCLAVVSADGALPAAEPLAAEAEREDPGGARRPDRSAGAAATAVDALGGYPLDRRHQPGVHGSAGAASAPLARARDRHLPARIHARAGPTRRMSPPWV